MNIQKTDLLLLNKIKFGASENAPQAPVPATEQTPEAGMKALSFKGMQNLMSNPSLAQRLAADGDEQTDSKSPAFKGLNAKAAKNTLLTAAVVLAGLGAASCSDKPDKYIQISEQTTIVEQDTQMMAIFQALLEEIKGMRQDMKDRDAKYQQQFNQIVNMFTDLYNMLQQGILDTQAFLSKIMDNQDVIISLMEQQGIKSDKANQLLQDILNSNMSMDEKLAAIKSLITDIKSMIAKGLEYAAQAQKDRQELNVYVRSTYNNTNKLVQLGEKAYTSDSIQIANQEQMLAKLDIIDIDMNANSEALAEQLGIQHSELMALLEKMGYDIKGMSAKEIYNAIKENTSVLKETNKQLREGIDKVDTDLNAAKTEILEALEKIDGHILDLTDAFKAFAQSQKKFNAMSLIYARQTANNTAKTATNTAYTNVLVENLYDAVDSLSLFDGGLSAKMDSLITVVKEADNNNQAGNTEIVNAIKEAKAVLVSLGVKVDGLSNEAILAELQKQTKLLGEQKAELVDIRKELADLKKQHAAGLIKDEEYSNKASQYSERIIELLENTKLDTASILLALGDISQNVEVAGKNYENALNKIQNNTYYSSYYIQKLYEAYEADAAQREAMKVGIEQLLPYIKNIDGTTTDIYQYLINQGVDKADAEKVIAAIQKAAGDQINVANANKNEIIANLEDIIRNQELQLDVQREILEKMKGLNPGSGSMVDLTTIEKELADILAAIKDLKDALAPKDYENLLKEIRDKIKPCNCNCGELKVVVEEIKTILEQHNSDEGIRNQDGGFIS